MFGPTGVGVLYGKKSLLETMPPYQGGGEMIETVERDRVTYAKPPHRFEAGTPPIVEAIGLGAAIDFLGELGAEAIAAHERELGELLYELIEPLQGVQILGTRQNVERVGLVCVAVDGVQRQCALQTQ